MMNRTRGIVLALMLLAVSLLSALLAYSVLTSTALAQDSDNRVCPLSDDQTQKSIQAFDKIANVFTKEPRCVNCHGAVNPFGADANRTHGGGKLQPIFKTDDPTARDFGATFAQCQQCHSAFPEPWLLAPSNLLFVGKDAIALCKQEKEFFSKASYFIDHIEHDAILQEGFTGKMGLNALGRSLAAKYPAPPTGVTHQNLIQMAHDWVDAQGGEFRGGPECGCKKHRYAIGMTETGVSDIVFAHGAHSHADMSGQADVPLTFKDDGSFSGQVTLPESFTEWLTASNVVCSGKGPFSNQMMVTGKVIEKEHEDNTMHLKFSWSSSGTVSGTCTSKGVTNSFNKSRPGVNSSDVKSPLTEGFDMPAAVGETRAFTSTVGEGQFTFTHAITIKQID
jgi:hypothetical protein